MHDRRKAFAWVIIAYFCAVAAAAATIEFLPPIQPFHQLFWRTAAADVVATLVVFGFSFRFDNSSFYDPFWSVAPPILAAFWMLQTAAAGAPLLRKLLVLALVTWWGARLTYNWARGWRGLDHEDWRYVDFRPRAGRAYYLVSFFGFHLFPTVQVFAGCAAVYATMVGTARLGILDAIFALVTAAAISFEAIADKQLHEFKKRRTHPEEILDSGLWAFTRHPNYFGEVGFWWGLSGLGVAAMDLPIGMLWWIFVGPLAITLMFFFISIPLIDMRMLKSRPAYAEQILRISRLVPWLPR